MIRREQVIGEPQPLEAPEHVYDALMVNILLRDQGEEESGVERQGMQLFMQDLARGAFTYAPPTLGQLARAMEVDRRFADLSLGLVDPSPVHGLCTNLIVAYFWRVLT